MMAEKCVRPKVSVIVLTYNHEKFISRAIEGILCQKVNFDIEILISDDCSTDRTPEIINKYKIRYGNIISVFHNEKNLGVAENSYKMILEASGEYIATCEGDDYWTDPEKLQKQVDLLDAHPEYSGCSHKVTLVDENCNALKNQNIDWICDDEVFTAESFKGIFLPGQPSSFLRRNLSEAEKQGFSDLFLCKAPVSDRAIILIWLRFGSFYRINENMGCYRILSSGITLNYKRNDVLFRDYEYTKRLELYSNLHNIGVDFTYHKCQLFISALKNGCVFDKRLKGLLSDSVLNFNGLASIFLIILEKIQNKLGDNK